MARTKDTDRQPVEIDAAERDEPQDERPPTTDAEAALASDDDDGDVLGDLPLTARVEALLVSSDRPLTEARLGELVGLPGKGAAKTVREAIEALNEQYEHTGRSFRIERLAGGFQVLTTASFGPLLERLHTERQHSRLSPAALETLAIIAYRQPILRAEVEAIRGVASGEVLRTLMDRRLVKITGRAEELGRPMLYGTTNHFLQVFGLSSLDDLPAVAGLERRPSPPKKSSHPNETDDTPQADPSDAVPRESTDDAPEGDAGG